MVKLNAPSAVVCKELLDRRLNLCCMISNIITNPLLMQSDANQIKQTGPDQNHKKDSHQLAPISRRMQP
jgi:hypothetical protein